MAVRKWRSTREMRTLSHKAMCDELKAAQHETREEIARRITSVCHFSVDPDKYYRAELLITLACRLAERIIDA